MSDDILKLFEGLNRQQVRALSDQALPVLRELRRAIEAEQAVLTVTLAARKKKAQPADHSNLSGKRGGG